MALGDDEAIDFKPFFDMVVGVLFILLILVSAQLFFSQWQSAPSASELAAREAEARRLAFEADIDLFLQDLAQALAAQGFTPAVDRVARSLAVPAGEVLTARDGARGADGAALARFGRVLLEALACVTPRATAACPRVSRARIARLDTRLRLPSPAGGGTPEPGARVAALALAAALFSASPGLLLIAGPTGAPAVQTAVRVEATAGEAPDGRFVLDFALVER